MLASRVHRRQRPPLAVVCTISVCRPDLELTGMIFLHDDSKLLTDHRNSTVDFETRSSNLFMPSSSCDSSCSGHKLYDPNANSTACNLSKTSSLTFQDGSTVGGDQFTIVSIAGLAVGSITFCLNAWC